MRMGETEGMAPTVTLLLGLRRLSMPRICRAVDETSRIHQQSAAKQQN